MYSCPLCFRAYERADHLNRHVNSHQNARTFRCPECPKGFNRQDILQRHRAAHAKNQAEGKPQARRRIGRVSRACKPCAVAKAKCDEAKPCKRCRIQDETCEERQSFSLKTTPRNDSPASSSCYSTCDNSPPGRDITASVQEQACESQYSVALPNDDFSSTLSVVPPIDGANVNASSQQQTQHTSQTLAGCFNPTIATETHLIDTLPPTDLPYNFLDFMPSTDLLLDEMETLDFDFDADVHPFLEDLNSAEARKQTEKQKSPDNTQDSERTSSRIEAFKRSPWFWKPSSSQNAFSDHPQMPLESDNVDVATSPHWPYAVDLVMQDKLNLQSRDRILQLVIQTVGSRVSIPLFPTAEFLDVLIRNGIAKKIETDAWIHPHTFCSRTTRTELLIALIASGCICSGITSVGKTGGMLQEIVRVALTNLMETDNSVIRDLQYLQAYMIWLDIGIWCGYKRKMEIAESNFQPLCTALRKAGAFHRSFYRHIFPSVSDDDESLEQKWKQWVVQESYKRLIYHLFEHDIQVAFTMTRNPLTSYAEFSAPFPAERDMWLAPTPSAWRATYLSKVRSPDPNHTSLRDMLTKPDLLNNVPADVDSTTSTSLFVHGIGASIWDYQKQASITLQESQSPDNDPTAQLWLQQRRQNLYQLLQTIPNDRKRTPAVLTLLVEFLKMYLHASLDDIQRFAGKHGEDEARRSHRALEGWRGTRAARIAVWHAGQVLCAARSVPPYQMRGADAIMVYHAALTLWAYGALRRVEREGSGAGVDGVVCLDGPGCSEQVSFLAAGIGTPVLSVCYAEAEEGSWVQQRREDGDGDVVEVQPSQVMRVGAQVLEGNYPNAGRDELPPMIMSLRNLMRDLGRLP